MTYEVRKVLVLFSLLAVLSASSAQAMGRKHPTQSTTPTPTASPTPASSPTDAGTVTGHGQPITGASTCVSTDPNHMCIGVKLVSYLKNGVPVLDQAQAIAVIDRINTVWSTCNVSFQLETYEALDPTTKGLSYDIDWENDGDTVRSAFNDSASFLVVAAGQLKGSTTGVTEPPGVGVYGSLIEDAYAEKELTIAHELGHYQGLYHVSDSSNLMYAYAESNNRTLTTSQCSTARKTNNNYWQTMMRN